LLAGPPPLPPATAHAQEAPPASTAPSDTIGPQELQNFSLNGTVTRPADKPAAPQAAPQRREQQTQAQTTAPAPQPSTALPATTNTETATGPAPASQQTQTAAGDVVTTPQLAHAAPEALRQSAPSSSVTVALPNVGSGETAASAAVAPASTGDFAPEPSTGTLAPGHGFSLLPWLLAALVLALGGAFLFWRNRSRQEFAAAGGPRVDAFVAPQPAPAPAPQPRRAPEPALQPAPAPKPAATAAPVGVVSTRLRPWIDIGFHPIRCVLDDERLMVEFDIELFNSGSGPARAVLVEGSLFNAGPAQDQEIGAFFANPVGDGERLAVIPPLKRVALRTQVAVPRAQVQAYELAGRPVFVPVIAFNALYSWSSGEGQTSVSYLLGKDTKGEKMGPFRMDLGSRIFRGVAAHLLPAGLRK
jgi:hypothetical protein